MPFSHHSHSGQFCAHAHGTLEEMVQQAISLQMKVYALTEHMPRDLIDRYPEEASFTPHFKLNLSVKGTRH
jgi:histidinol-phosphatase (PHP family)